MVGGVRQTLNMLAHVGCGVVLSGHLHRVSSGDTRPYHVELARSILVFQAGTAVSQRRRGEPNAYNRIQISDQDLELEVRNWNGKQFRSVSTIRYRHTATGWVPSEL